MTAEITIVCTAEVHTEPYEVFRFRLKNDEQTGGRPAWVSGSSWLGNPESATSSHPTIKGWNGAAAQLVGDRYISDEDKRHDPTLVHRDDFRVRYAFECDCGDNVPARYATLAPILDTLAAAGIDTISLSALAARIRNQAR